MAIYKSSVSGIPSGNTASRPSSPSVGTTYYNGELGYLEIYTSSGWKAAQASSSNTSYVSMPGSLYYASSMDCAVGTYSLAMTTDNKTAKIQFFDANDTLITTASLNGLTPVTVNLATAAKKVRGFQPWSQSLSGGVTASIEFKGGTLVSNTYSGTVTQYTTTQSVSLSGTAYIILVGGGGSGATGYNGYGGGGGGSGGIAEKLATGLSGSYTITIGSGLGNASGQGGSDNTANNGRAGSTTFSNAGGTIFSATGGTTGNVGWFGNSAAGSGGSGTGSYDYAGGARGGFGRDQGPKQSAAYATIYQHAKSFIVQGGLGGNSADSSTVRLDYSNGLPGIDSVNGGNATGYGNGGGGVATGDGNGGRGSDGCAFIITGLQEI